MLITILRREAAYLRGFKQSHNDQSVLIHEVAFSSNECESKTMPHKNA